MLSILEERGFLNQVVGERAMLEKALTAQRCGVYVGVDPTAPSLHVGHMVPFMALGWMYIHGYPSTFLLGGATARVGDPTDRMVARDTVHSSTRKMNTASMHIQLKKLGELMEKYADGRGYAREWAWRRALVNNGQWWDKLPMLDFMKVMGNGMRIGPLLGRDTVKNRMEKGAGMSFAEFTYPLMQAWDWWELYKKGCQVQIGGSDQFGNILAGAEAVKYMARTDPTWLNEHHNPNPSYKSRLPTRTGTGSELQSVFDDPIGFTVPLLTTSAGEKFGKSAGNAIWLDKDMTSSFDLYQFFLRSADADIEKYLKLFTFLPMSEIKTILKQHDLDRGQRIAQHKLAKEFLEMTRGLTEANEAEKQHRRMFSRTLTVSDLRNESQERTPGETAHYGTSTSSESPTQINAANAPSVRIKLPRSLVCNQSIVKVMHSAGLVSSKSEGQRLAVSKGAHIGSKSSGGEMGSSLTFQPITTWKPEDTEKFIIEGNLLILRVGKWRHKIIEIVSDEEYERLGLTCPGWKPDEEDRRETKEAIKEAA